MRDLPTGTVTFLFTDIEGSTKLLRRLGEQYRDVITLHHQILRGAIGRGGGTEVGTEGDAFFAVFPSPTDALATAVYAQRSLADARWPEGQTVRVRMGLHTGQAVMLGEGHMGLDIHLAARIAAAGHGGQVLLSDATRLLVEPGLPDGVSLRDLERHRLKDFERPQHLYDLVIDGLDSTFPEIRTLDARPTNLPGQRTSFVGRQREVEEVTALVKGTHLVTLTGPRGTGKTRLALKVAADQLDRFADGVFFVDLTPITDPDLVPSVIGQALLVRDEPGRDLLDTLTDHVRDRHVLIVLDNAEQEIRDPQLLAWSLLDLADVPTWAKDYDRAEAMLREGLASAEEAADRPLASEVRAVLGRLAYYRGDLAAALEAYQEAVAIQRGLGADRLVAINVARLADVEVHLGQLDAAEEHYRESLVMVTEAGNDVISAVMLVFLAWVASRKASYRRAARLIGAVDRMREEIGGGPTREVIAEWIDAEDEARRALGDEAFEQAEAEGFSWTLEEAVSYALERSG